MSTNVQPPRGGARQVAVTGPEAPSWSPERLALPVAERPPPSSDVNDGTGSVRRREGGGQRGQERLHQRADLLRRGGADPPPEVPREPLTPRNPLHGVAGNYNRFDVLSLVLNRSPLAAIHEVEAAPTGTELTGPEPGRLLGQLRRRVGSASPEEIRALVESLLASLPAAFPTPD